MPPNNDVLRVLRKQQLAIIAALETRLRSHRAALEQIETELEIPCPGPPECQRVRRHVHVDYED